MTADRRRPVEDRLLRRISPTLLSGSGRFSLQQGEGGSFRMSPARWWGLRDAFPGVAQPSMSSPMG